MINRLKAAQWIVVAAPLLIAAPGCVQTVPQTLPERPAEIRVPQERESTNLDVWRAQFSAYSRGPLHTRTRRAICTDKSVTAGCQAEVTIQAIGLSTDINPDSAPSRGRVIGQIRNLDPRDVTEMDSLKPSSQADYYIYIDAAPSGRARWNLLEVPNSREGFIRRIVQPEIRKCGERPGYRWRRSDVDFAPCGGHYMESMYKAEILTSSGLMHFVSGIAAHMFHGSAGVQPGKWYGCPDGCCT